LFLGELKKGRGMHSFFEWEGERKRAQVYVFPGSEKKSHTLLCRGRRRKGGGEANSFFVSKLGRERTLFAQHKKEGNKF